MNKMKYFQISFIIKNSFCKKIPHPSLRLSSGILPQYIISCSDIPTATFLCAS